MQQNIKYLKLVKTYLQIKHQSIYSFKKSVVYMIKAILRSTNK